MTDMKAAFANFANVYSALSSYNSNPTDENAKILSMITANTTSGMPLPSGKWGTVLAVALEMNLYTSALFLIENSEVLGINLNSISSSFGGNNFLNAYDTFKLSATDFDFELLPEDHPLFSQYPDVLQAQNLNRINATKVREILNSVLSRVSQK